MEIRGFENIEERQLVREFTRGIYALTKKTNFALDYGLEKQIQNAAGSSMHNIVAGIESKTDPESIRFLRYAKPSCSEVQSQLYFVIDQQYIKNTQFQHLYDHAGRTRAVLSGFIKYLSAYRQNPGKLS